MSSDFETIRKIFYTQGKNTRRVPLNNTIIPLPLSLDRKLVSFYKLLASRWSFSRCCNTNNPETRVI